MPHDRPAIATPSGGVTGDRYACRPASAPVPPITGPFDVHAVFGAPGMCRRESAFAAR